MSDQYDILKDLNQDQSEAVQSESRHLLVLAGAGSGKTRVLAHKAAWLVKNGLAHPRELMALTFTNKAAKEMQSRMAQMIPVDNSSWISTFHSINYRILYENYKIAALSSNFQIIDGDDQKSIIKRLIKEMGFSESYLDPKGVQAFIGKQKDRCLRPDMIEVNHHFDEINREIYQQYHHYCLKNHLVDFSELILRVYELFESEPLLLKHYQDRFEYLMVDEFQDTNLLQYRWIKRLCGDQIGIIAVGDDDQSIYGWRGALVENVQQFLKDYDCHLVRLEQNFRSTQNILNVANAVIKNNKGRLEKNLWTDAATGEQVRVFPAFNEQDEAEYVVQKMKDLSLNEGYSYQEMAVLYRSNRQSRVLEEKLVKNQVPYCVYSGQRFYERAEIKCVLAYLSLILNPDNDHAFERIINVPTRGIGHVTLDKIRQFAKAEERSLWQATNQMLHSDLLTERAKNSLNQFVELIQNLQVRYTGRETTFSNFLTTLINQTGLVVFYESDAQKKVQRLENLEELVYSAKGYDDSERPLEDFLSNVMLESGQMQSDEENKVSLITIHASKGLEFPIVFLVGLEEGLFPSGHAIESEKNVEEERRLFYVAVTRAMKCLYLSYAEMRQFRQSDRIASPSRFLDEIPTEYLYQERELGQHMVYRGNVSEQRLKQASHAYQNQSSQTQHKQYRIGLKLVHPVFGEGVVLNIQTKAKQLRLQIKFAQSIKWILPEFVELGIID